MGILSSLVASFHFVALGIGFGSVFMRGRYFKSLSQDPSNQADIQRLMIADAMWGIAALLWLASGLWRAFGGLEKGSQFYLQNAFFHLKMTLFVLVLILELKPMVALIKLRMARKKSPTATLESDAWVRYRKINHYEAVLILLMVFAASAMARGLWQIQP